MTDFPSFWQKKMKLLLSLSEGHVICSEVRWWPHKPVRSLWPALEVMQQLFLKQHLRQKVWGGVGGTHLPCRLPSGRWWVQQLGCCGWTSAAPADSFPLLALLCRRVVMMLGGGSVRAPPCTRLQPKQHAPAVVFVFPLSATFASLPDGRDARAGTHAPARWGPPADVAGLDSGNAYILFIMTNNSGQSAICFEIMWQRCSERSGSFSKIDWLCNADKTLQISDRKCVLR